MLNSAPKACTTVFFTVGSCHRVLWVVGGWVGAREPESFVVMSCCLLFLLLSLFKYRNSSLDWLLFTRRPVLLLCVSCPNKKTNK